MGKKKIKVREVNLLDLVAERAAGHEVEEETGLVTILAPRFRNRLMKRLFEPRVKNPHLKIKLDEIGSAVWLLIDGERNVKEIAAIVRERFQEKIEPCFDRLNLFFQQLEGGKFICYLNLEECRQDAARSQEQAAVRSDDRTPSS